MNIKINDTNAQKYDFEIESDKGNIKEE